MALKGFLHLLLKYTSLTEFKFELTYNDAYDSTA
jgi:hypothetical protein